jgi:hypothetical protein
MPDTPAPPANATALGNEPECEPCQHPARKVIDLKLAKREPTAQVANQFDLPKAAVENHRPHAQPPRARFSGDPGDLVRHLVELDEQAAIRIAAAGDQKVAAQLLGERRRIAIDMARLNKAHDKCMSASMYNRLIELLAGALGPFPEARAAAQRAIDEWHKEQGWN